MITPDCRLAIIYRPLPQFLTVGGFLERGLSQLCAVTHFLPGEETDGFDHYLYVDDGPTAYMEPKYHPATFYAIDMVVKPISYSASIS